MFIQREQESNIKTLLKYFPVVSVSGPRQSGKSTLLKNAFADYKYLSLEDPQVKKRALADPVSFIRDTPGKLIIDEVQFAPEIFPMIQVVCDEQKLPGQYILSGSQNFLLLKHIGESLAGRVGITKLLPLSYKELSQTKLDHGIDDVVFRGGYPQLYSEDIPSDLLFQNYISTYVERDVTDYLGVRNKHTFTQLIGLLAQYSGNLVNISSLSNELNVSFQTLKSWLSILEASYIIFFLAPYHANSAKRLTKTNKFYFWDTGFLCYLLGLQSSNEAVNSSHSGAVFENFVIAERAKNYLNAGKKPILYFYRDDSKREIDLLDFTDRKNLKAFEIKASRTYHDKFSRHLNSVGEEIGIPQKHRSVICKVEKSYVSKNINVFAADEWLLDTTKGKKETNEKQ